MKKIFARIIITSKPEVKDPFGKAKLQELQAYGYGNAQSIIAGKAIEIEFTDLEKPEVEKQVQDMCQKFLTNPVIETFSFTLEEISVQPPITGP